MTVKYQKKRKRGALPTIIVVVALIIAFCAAGYFGVDFYLRSEYPIKYEAYVEFYARENGLDPYLVYAVIKTESGFHTDARSDVGARGLMQIMQDTFDWIKYRSGDDKTEYSDMYNAGDNIKYGCLLLGYLTEEFGDVETVMAAYHAGRGNVNNWLADKRYSRDGKHLDEIPISDTAHYVNKIMRAVEIYYYLYEK